MKITKADARALDLLRNEWFYPNAVDYMIRDPQAWCRKMEHLDILESKVESGHTSLSRVVYRKRAAQ